MGRPERAERGSPFFFCVRLWKMRGSLGWAAFLLAALSFAQSDDPAAKSQRGKEAMAAGKFAEAATIYAELVKTLPDNAGLLMNLGMAQHMAGQPSKAIPQFKAALKLDPGLFPAWLLLGVAHLEIGQPAGAVEPLRKALTMQPDNTEARHALGDALFAVERFEEAADQFRQLSDRNASDPRAWHALGRSYESLSRRAFAQLEKAAPESSYWLALVAGTRLAQQQYSGAFYFYHQALQKQPDLRGAHGTLAEIYRRTGHADWAAVEEGKERRLGPLDCASHRIECDFLQGRYREAATAAGRPPSAESYYFQSLAYNELALQAFERLAKLPPSAELHQLIAESHHNQGHHIDAVKEWREALKLSPGNPEIRRELAISLHQSRDYNAAEVLLRDLLKRDPGSVELNYCLGDSLLNLQQPEKAVPFLSQAVKRDASVLPAQASLARAYLQMGQAAQAIPHLEAALPVDDDGSLHYQLARAYQGAGRQELAKQTLEQYQKIHASAEADRKKLEQEVRITPPE